MSFFLICLSITDTMSLYMILLPQLLAFYDGFYDANYIPNDSYFLCKLKAFLGYFLPHLDSWIIVNLTLERLAAVMFPFRCREWFTKSRAAVYLLITILFLFAIDGHFFWTFTLQPRGCWSLPQYHDFIDSIWSWIDMCLFSIIPTVIIIICNVCICVKMFTSHSMHNAPSQAHKQSLMRLKRTIVVLLVVSTVLIVTSLPGCVWYIILSIVYGKFNEPWMMLTASSLFYYNT